MKGIILAGGTGSRLYPLTNITNKHLLPVYNRPMVYYPLETLIRSGITDILIVTGKMHAGSFMNLLGSGRDFDAKFHYAIQDEAGGIAQALALAEDFVQNDNMTVILGDNIIFDNIHESVANFRKNAKIFLKEVSNPQRFGVPVFDGSRRLIKIEEKPEKPKSPYAITGLYMYDNTVFEKINSLKPSARGELEITDVNNLYLKEGQLEYAFLDEPWLDAGTFDSLLTASNVIKEKLEGKSGK